MRLNLFKYLAVGVMVVVPMGCEPTPVAEPGDNDTTVIEERDTTVEPGDVDSEPDTGVSVDVGAEPGADVGVDREQSDDSSSY